MPSPNLENGHAYWCQSMGHHTAAECNCGWDALLEDAGARQAAVDREESARATRAAEDRAEKERGVVALERIAAALERLVDIEQLRGATMPTPPGVMAQGGPIGSGGAAALSTLRALQKPEGKVEPGWYWVQERDGGEWGCGKVYWSDAGACWRVKTGGYDAGLRAMTLGPRIPEPKE